MPRNLKYRSHTSKKQRSRLIRISLNLIHLHFLVYRYIVGLVSLGRDTRDGSCGSEAIPSMYTDLTYFRKWVMHHVEALESISTKYCEGKTVTEELKKPSRTIKRLNDLDDNC